MDDMGQWTPDEGMKRSAPSGMNTTDDEQEPEDESENEDPDEDPDEDD
jgi:hypothetical protein